MTQIIRLISITGIMLVLNACGKEFLDLKATKSQQIPQTIANYQAITDYAEYQMNIFSSHEIGIIGGDEYTISDLKYQTFPLIGAGLKISYQKNAYSWATKIYEGGEGSDWRTGYTRILRANVAIDGLSKNKPTANEQLAWNNALGCALFHRAINYYNLAQLYCKAYDQENAETDMGLPLRKQPDVTESIQRESLKATYDFIIADLEKALLKLPDVPITIYRPGRPAVYALLARLYLQMGNYIKAEANANQCLKLKSKLLDFNLVNLNQRFTFPANGNGNPEILFMNELSNLYITAAFFNADKDLLNNYSENDLRIKAYYYLNTDGRVLFKGSYGGNVYFFTGLATDEVYLIRAECRIRNGKLQEALDDLNNLLIHRYESNNFKPYSSSDEFQVLNRILQERRKELVLRGTRWEDLKRLNKDHRLATTLTRVINNKQYDLIPNDKLYIWPLPPEAILFGGYKQNIR